MADVPRRVPVERHNEVLAAALARVDRLEGRLARIVEPILARAGEQAATNFLSYATNHLTAAASDETVTARSTMICVRPRPDEAATIADPDGDPPERLHVTLAYLGETDGDLGAVADALRPVAALLAPLVGVVGGYGVFDPPGVGILLPDVRGLVELRVAVCEALLAAGVDYGRQHGFSAHISVNASAGDGTVQRGIHESDIPERAGAAPSSRSSADGRLPDLSEESFAGTLGPSEGRREDDVRTSDRLGAPTRFATVFEDSSTPPLRERPVFERTSHAADDERGAWPSDKPAAGVLQRSRDPLRSAEQKRPRSLPSLRAGSVGAASSAEEGGTYPAQALGAPLHFDAIIVTRGDEDEYVLPLVGVPPLTAAGDPPQPPQWSAPFPNEILDVEALVAEILARTEPVRLAMIEQTMTPALKEAGLSWDVTNPLAGKVLAASASQVRGIAETTQLNVMRIVRAAYENGLTIPQTSGLIREGMKEASKARATMIARTELGRAANGGSLAATQIVAGATGSRYSKAWHTSIGARFPRHEDYVGLDGQTVALDATFTVGEDQLQYPGDPDGDPGETINCRCVLLYRTPQGAEEADAESPPDLLGGL